MAEVKISEIQNWSVVDKQRERLKHRMGRCVQGVLKKLKGMESVNARPNGMRGWAYATKQSGRRKTTHSVAAPYKKGLIRMDEV